MMKQMESIVEEDEDAHDSRAVRQSRRLDAPIRPVSKAIDQPV
jgi:hypothetical protein